MLWWWLAGIAMVVVGLVGAVVLIGLALPRDHTATSRARVNAPAQEVWDTLMDFRRHPAWRTGVTKCEPLEREDGATAWVEHSRFGQLPMFIELAEEPSLIVGRVIDDNLPFGGTWSYRITPDEGGSMVAITENGTIRNPIFRFMSRFIMGHHGTLDQYLRDLSRKFGAEATPEHVAGS